MSLPYLSLTPYGHPELVLVNGPPYRPYVIAGQNWGNPVWEHQFSGPRGTQGARPSQGKLPNREVALALRLYGENADDVAARLSELSAAMEAARRHGGYITRRATGQTYRQYLEVLTTPGVTVPEWDKRTDVTNLASPLLNFVCAPYAVGDAMAWEQSYTAAADLASLEVASGSAVVLNGATGRFTVDAAFTTGSYVLDRLRGYLYGDVRLDVRLSIVNTSNAHRCGGVLLRYVNASNWLGAFIETDGTTFHLRLIVKVAGSETVLGTSSFASTPVGEDYTWISAWIEANTVYAEARVRSGPSPYGEHVAPDEATSATLSTAQAAVVGNGVTSRVGLYVSGKGADADAGIIEWRCQPYYYTGAGRPGVGNIALSGVIPGDAPALGEVAITTPAANTAAARFALIGWTGRRAGRNRCWNGDLERNADGWSGSAVTGVHGAATSVGATSTSYRGTQGLLVDPTTTDDSGASFRMWDQWRKGVTYRATAYLLASGSSANAELFLGRNGDLALSAAAAPGQGFGNWTAFTVDWTPTADYSDAYVGIRASGTHGINLTGDAFVVRELVDQALPVDHSEGRGAYPPLYAVPAVGHEQETGTTDTSDAGTLVGTKERATASGAGSLALSYLVDPALTSPDDYTQGELDLEVWARVNMDNDLSGVRGVAWANPPAAAYNADTLGARRVGGRFGLEGRPITRPITGDAWRMVRLGVVPLAIDRAHPGAWRLTVAFTWSGGADNLDVDYVVMVPARSRCLTPTGLSYAAGGYPAFIDTHADEVTKTVRSDLSAVVSAPPSPTQYPDHGMGDSLLEIPAGQVDLLVVLSDLVPDDPDASAAGCAVNLSAAVSVSPIPRWAHLRDA